MCRYALSFLGYKEVNSRNCQKSGNYRIFSPPCRNPLADLKNFASKRAPAYPLSTGLHLMTLRQKQKKVAVLFTKMSTLTSKNVQTPAPGAPMGRSSPNYLVPVPGICSTLSQNFTPIATSCVEISWTVQTKNKQKNKSKLNITPNATLYGEIKSDISPERVYHSRSSFSKKLMVIVEVDQNYYINLLKTSLTSSGQWHIFLINP